MDSLFHLYRNSAHYGICKACMVALITISLSTNASRRQQNRCSCRSSECFPCQNPSPGTPCSSPCLLQSQLHVPEVLRHNPFFCSLHVFQLIVLSFCFVSIFLLLLGCLRYFILFSPSSCIQLHLYFCCCVYIGYT